MSDVQGDGSPQDLIGLIGQTTYQGSDVNGESGVSDGADSTVSGLNEEGLSPAPDNVAGAAPGEVSEQGVTPPAQEPPAVTPPTQQTTPPVDPNLQQLQETIVNQQRYIDMHQQQIRYQQEQEFRKSLEDMDPTERELAIKDRQLRFLQQQNQNLTKSQREAQAREQETSKRQLAYIVAVENGLPEYLYTSLLSANSPEEMESEAARIARNLKSQFQPIQHEAQQVAPPQQQQQQQPNPAFAAGGDGGSSQVTQEVEPGSGDLMGLISQNQYQVIRNW